MKIICMTFLLSLFIFQVVYADDIFVNSSIEIQFINKLEMNANVTNSAVIFESKDLIIKAPGRTDLNGRVTILGEIPKDSKILVKGLICLSNENRNRTVSGLVNLTCSAYPFYFYLLEGHYELSITLQNIVYKYRNETFGFNDENNNLLFCSIFLTNEINVGLVYNYTEFFENLKSSCNLSLNEEKIDPGTYFLELLGSDTSKQTGLVSFLEVIKINTTNPYSEPATGNFEIIGAKCFFETGEKTLSLDYRPKESKNLTILCPNQTSFNENNIYQNFTTNNYYINITSENIIFGAVTSIILSILSDAISYFLQNPKSAKKERIKKIIIFSLVSWLIISLVITLI